MYGNTMGWREALPEAVTLPQHFKTHGYHTRSVGKIAHAATWDDELSWSAPIWSQRWTIDKATTPSWQILDVLDDELTDGKIANESIKILTQIKDEQFFLAVGFHKPHLPYNVPRKYYDLYDIETFKNVLSVTPHPRNDVRAYADIPDGNAPISEKKVLELMRGYAASTSYMDAQVGRVLQQLDALSLSQNTVIVFAGDHGFHLGEHGTWRKNTLFEVSLRSPMIISLPGQQSNRTDALVELVDIYPTLCDVCQLPVPLELEGLSLTPIIEQPAQPWKTAAFSQLGGDDTKKCSIRTERYRYTEQGNSRALGRELYDYQVDPDETVNIAYLPENRELVAQLNEQLRAGWRAALPVGYERVPGAQTLRWDINEDGVVDMKDLILISNNFGAAPEYPKIDVNKDGRVNIIDLLIVAAHFGETSNAAAPPNSTALLPEYVDHVEGWVTEARLINDNTAVFQRGIATLEGLLNNVIPEKTVLLPNYPNPFNPETWIPYDLAEDAHVRIHIYNVKGESIQELMIGFQTAGTYRTQLRAAYWDGRNATGEPVASGVYFYSLNAGHKTTTRQMVIRK